MSAPANLGDATPTRSAAFTIGPSTALCAAGRELGTVRGLRSIAAMEPLAPEMDLLRRATLARREKAAAWAAGLDRVAREHEGVLHELHERGYVRVRAAVPAWLADSIRRRVDDLCARGKHLIPPANVADHPAGADYRSAARLGADEVALGERHLRNRTSSLTIADPLLAVPTLVDIALDESLLDLAGAYLGAPPLLGFVKLVKSFANELPAFDTEEFHVDGNSARILKAFLYLHEIDEGRGAHCFVEGSHRQRIDDWDVTARAPLALIEDAYGAHRIVSHVGAAGDLVLEDTSGFHRRGKATRADRRVAIFNYVMHDEYGGGGERARIAETDYVRLTEKQRCAADLLERRAMPADSGD